MCEHHALRVAGAAGCVLHEGDSARAGRQWFHKRPCRSQRRHRLDMSKIAREPK